jgi:hypothetical protein
VPIADMRDALKCGVAVVDWRSGKHLAHFQFVTGVEEIFDVRVLASATNPYIAGPMVSAEGRETIWYAPDGNVPSKLKGERGGVGLPSTVLPSPLHRDVPTGAWRLYQQGIRYAEQDNFAAAADHFRRAVHATPGFVDALWNLGTSLQFLGEIDESIAALRKAVDLQPDLPPAHMNLAMSLFLKGDFVKAWEEYEWRWQCARFGKRPLAALRLAPAWSGEPLAGKRILVYGEQGIGDEIMFASAYPQLIGQASQCMIGCEPRLSPLFRRSFPKAVVVGMDTLSHPKNDEQIGKFDFQAAAGSLLRHLRPHMSAVDAPSSYLMANRESIERWESRLADLRPALIVGISWRGGSDPAEARRRSANLGLWSPVLQVPRVRFVSLQYGAHPAELADAGLPHDREIGFWKDMDPLADMDDLAALIAAVDLVISVDNSTVHLAGALGVPTWALISFPSSSYWRWLLEGESTVWYQHVRLFRKSAGEDWLPTMERVASELRQLSATKHSER